MTIPARGVNDMKMLRMVVVFSLVATLIAGAVPVSLAASGPGGFPSSMAFNFGKDKLPWFRSEVSVVRGTVNRVTEDEITVESAGEDVTQKQS